MVAAAGDPLLAHFLLSVFTFFQGNVIYDHSLRICRCLPNVHFSQDLSYGLQTQNPMVNRPRRCSVGILDQCIKD